MSASVAYAHYQFTVADYHRMLETGVLNEDSRVELLNGEILKMSPIGPRHAACVDRLSEQLRDQVKKIAIVRVQNPVGLDNYSEPEPDVTLLKRREDYYVNTHPQPDDIFLVVEVSDTTLERDRQTKLPLYAQTGIRELWLIDLPNDRIEIHSSPHNGVYQEVRIVQRGQKVVSKALPHLKLEADDLLV
jgi:Uma2 family endonuclease